MPDRRRHRGPHPGDRERFAPPQLATLRTAVDDYEWLLDRDYSPRAALKLVGDRFALDLRQRLFLQRGVCGRALAAQRRGKLLPPAALRGATLLIDGFNVLTTVEAALAGGLVIRCRDGTCRDLASMHGTWRRVDETGPAAQLVGERLAALGVGSAHWLLDRPVSNAGRLAAGLRAQAQQRGFPWQVEVVADPDRRLRVAKEPVATADGPVLDACGGWADLSRQVVEASVPDAWIAALD